MVIGLVTPVLLKLSMKFLVLVLQLKHCTTNRLIYRRREKTPIGRDSVKYRSCFSRKVTIEVHSSAIVRLQKQRHIPRALRVHLRHQLVEQL